MSSAKRLGKGEKTMKQERKGRADVAGKNALVNDAIGVVRRREVKDDVEANIQDDTGARPKAKKRRVETKSTSRKRTPCLLLDFRPEMFRNVLSFLMLKDALELGRTCRQLRRNNANDIFQYSCIMDHDGLDRVNVLEKSSYMTIQKRILCNPVSLNHFRAVLRNENLPQNVTRYFLWDMIRTSKTDNGQAVTILLENGRSDVYPAMLDDVLQKDYSSMKDALLKNEEIFHGIQMCSSFSYSGCTNLGCFECANDDCKAPDEQSDNEDDNGDDESVLGIKYCRSCVMENNLFCRECSYCICPACIRQGHFHECEDCEDVYCMTSPDDFGCARYVHRCIGCIKKICTDCVAERLPGHGMVCSSCAP